ncbi:hypothetical protein PILCRDRAFT_635266 [Piloderma croceum F 1598]|uniref:Uncharacterized protein n=1 Tax=Piloderma croceum (strain F 1598) TaxID=765440 RepID=A0A0C3FAH4_PILCF|nr:hypothetical protein PILCRDRAFT_635266 [Piloderma croceum F 1598]
MNEKYRSQQLRQEQTARAPHCPSPHDLMQVDLKGEAGKVRSKFEPRCMKVRDEVVGEFFSP